MKRPSSTALPVITIGVVKRRIHEVRHSQTSKGLLFDERHWTFYVSQSDLIALRREAVAFGVAFGDVQITRHGDLMVYGVLISATPELGMTKRMSAIEI